MSAGHSNNGKSNGSAGYTVSTPRKVYLCALKERTTLDLASNSIEKIMMRAGQAGWTVYAMPYARTDITRNHLAWQFMHDSTNPNDVLVMLDNDHVHPVNMVDKLIDNVSDEAGGVGVLGVLAYMRGEPYQPCFFARDDAGNLRPVAVKDETTEDAIFSGTIVGHAGVAIARWVFERLIANGFDIPFWRYEYNQGVASKTHASGLKHYPFGAYGMPSEDMYFGKICEQAGIAHWCFTSLEDPHLILSTVTGATFNRYLADHPEINDDASHTLEMQHA